MKRLAPLLLIALSLILFGCNRSEEYAVLREAVENTNNLQRSKADFIAEMTFENRAATLLFLQGSYSLDREEQLMNSQLVEMYLGSSGSLSEMYYDGYVYTQTEERKSRYPMEAQELFGYLYFAQPINFEYKDIKKLKQSENIRGTLYSFTVKSGYDEELLTLLGEGIYSLAKINVPQTEKTRFGEIKVEYTVSDREGAPVLASMQTVFTVFLYETPPYTPGYTRPEEDYMLELTVRIKVSYNDFGDGVEIAVPNIEEYSDLE